MKFFTTVAVATLGFASLFVPAANASTWSDDDCSMRNGTLVCLTRNGNEWALGLSNEDFSESFRIVCDGKFVQEWRSYGDLTRSEAENIAIRFCAA